MTKSFAGPAEPLLALRARLVFPVAGPPLRDAVLTLAGERIVAVGENLSGQPALDLGNVAILPGLVNAHTHLEFSNLAGPIGPPGQSLPVWIRQVVAHRHASASRSAGPAPAAAVLAGLAESAARGTTTLGEIATSDWSTPLAAHPAVVRFRESIGLRSEQIEPQLALVRTHLERPWPAEGDAPCGVSPHAPYSVHPELFERLVRLAGQRHVPVAMHLAESPEELELLAAGTGPFRTLLEELQVWTPGVLRTGTQILDYLRGLADAPRALVVHGNYLADSEIEFLAERADRMAVVYCPRTHAWFGHADYPLARMLAAGVHVALGTDSRASNPDLSLLAELRHVARHHPQVAPVQVLELGTLAGARALGLDGDVGSLGPGKLANLAVVPLAESADRDPYRLLFDSDRPACQTWIRGRALSLTAGS